MNPRTSFASVTDQFCGAGGSSLGATRAGAEVRLAAGSRHVWYNEMAKGCSQHPLANTINLIMAGCGEVSLPHYASSCLRAKRRFFMSPAQKQCHVCGSIKPLTGFYARPDALDGHRSECKECTKARSRASVERNPEHRAAYQAEYEATHRERINRQARERAARNRRYLYFRKYRAANLEHIHENEQAYRRRHPEVMTARRHQRRALEMDQETREYIAVLLRDPCSYCGGPGGTIDHIIPVAAGGTNHWSNLTSACMSCNSSKNDLGLLAFLEKHSES